MIQITGSRRLTDTPFCCEDRDVIKQASEFVLVVMRSSVEMLCVLTGLYLLSTRLAAASAGPYCPPEPLQNLVPKITIAWVSMPRITFNISSWYGLMTEPQSASG